MPLRSLSLSLALCLGVLPCVAQQPSKAAMDRDLMEVTIPRLHELYRSHRYTVTQVTRWYLDRIQRYNGVYRALEYVDAKAALETAAREDADRNGPHGPLWGVPIVLKENTSIAGLVTTDGWKGYTLPGHELIAPKDAPIVARMRAAGAVILGKTNMPDFAASDTGRSSSYGRTGNAYDVRFSPGGSSSGTVTAVTGNMAMLGNGTDTGNSIRMPASTSALVGVFPTRGLVPIAGIAPLDWLLDNTGPIARTVTDATIALDVMAGTVNGKPQPDALDARTAEAPSMAETGPYTGYLKEDALKGKRFGVPAFILHGVNPPFQGIVTSVSAADAEKMMKDNDLPLRPETRVAFMKAIEGLRAAGATVVFDDSILPGSFAVTASRVGTTPYLLEGTEAFLKEFGPAGYHSAEEYQRATGQALPATIVGGGSWDVDGQSRKAEVRPFSGPMAEADVLKPRAETMRVYEETMDRLHLDGYVYPAAQMPPPDETMPQDGHISGGPHSDTGWVNMIGVPAVVLPAGFYPSGLPFGMEISTRRWHDGDLLGWAYAYEQATHLRRPPVLVEQGLLPDAR